MCYIPRDVHSVCYTEKVHLFVCSFVHLLLCVFSSVFFGFRYFPTVAEDFNKLLFMKILRTLQVLFLLLLLLLLVFVRFSCQKYSMKSKGPLCHYCCLFDQSRKTQKIKNPKNIWFSTHLLLLLLFCCWCCYCHRLCILKRLWKPLITKKAEREKKHLQ